MIRTALALLAAALLPILVAASPSPIDSMEAFARAVGMKKGAWQTRVTITAVDFKPSPTATPEAFAKIRADLESRLGKVTLRNECLGTGSDRLPGIVIDPSCAFSRMEAADGRWTLDSACSDPAKRESATMKGEGGFSRKAVTGRHVGEASFKGVVVHVTAEFESRHVGKCRAPGPSASGR